MHTAVQKTIRDVDLTQDRNGELLVLMASYGGGLQLADLGGTQAASLNGVGQGLYLRHAAVTPDFGSDGIAMVASSGDLIDPVDHPFSGFVFKIQANMDPDHRDRIAFLRICSGQFIKGLQTSHVRTGKPIRLTNSTLLMGKDRAEVDEAFAGDVVGLFDPGLFRIGDTLADEKQIGYAGIPIFAPESFMRVEVAGVQKRKALEKGIEQLVQEGVVQLFRDPEGGSASWILGAMGPLQFDVMKHRLQSEYGVELTLSNLPYCLARWPQAGFDPEDFRYSERIRVVLDRDDNWALLAQSSWDFDRLLERNESLDLSETPDPSLFESAN